MPFSPQEKKIHERGGKKMRDVRKGRQASRREDEHKALWWKTSLAMEEQTTGTPKLLALFTLLDTYKRPNDSTRHA